MASNWVSNTPSNTQTVNLGFTIENRAGVEVLVWKDGGCRPAASSEVAMWKALSAVQQPVVREPLTNPEFVKCVKAAGLPWDSRMWELKQQIEEAHGIKGGQHAD